MAEDSEHQSVAVDVAPLLQSLPADVQRHLTAILQTYQRPGNARHAARDDSDEADGGDEADEDYVDDPSSGREDDKKAVTRPPVDAEPSYDGSSEDVSSESSPASNWVVGRDRPWPTLSPAEQRRPQRKRPASLGAAAADRSTSYFDVQNEDYEDSLSGDSVQLGGSSEEASSEIRADNKPFHDVQTTLSPQDRLALWRYWKDIQQGQEEVLRKRKRRKKSKQKKVGRSQREDAFFPRESFGVEVNGQSVPKNHRIE